MKKYYCPYWRNGFAEYNKTGREDVFNNYNVGNGFGYQAWWRTGDGDRPITIYDFNIIYGIYLP